MPQAVHTSIIKRCLVIQSGRYAGFDLMHGIYQIVLLSVSDECFRPLCCLVLSVSS